MTAEENRIAKLESDLAAAKGEAEWLKRLWKETKKYMENHKCKNCDGTGAEDMDGGKAIKCSICNGKGFVEPVPDPGVAVLRNALEGLLECIESGTPLNEDRVVVDEAQQALAQTADAGGEWEKLVEAAQELKQSATGAYNEKRTNVSRKAFKKLEEALDGLGVGV
jgi:hypothetical protein